MVKGGPGVAVGGSEDGPLLVKGHDLVQLPPLDGVQEGLLNLGSGRDVSVSTLRATVVDKARDSLKYHYYYNTVLCQH